MENHTEKKRIFNEYAKEQGYTDWDTLQVMTIIKFQDSVALKNHIFSACDLVQKELQKRTAEKLPSNREIFLKNEATKDLILSESNLIK